MKSLLFALAAIFVAGPAVAAVSALPAPVVVVYPLSVTGSTDPDAGARLALLFATQLVQEGGITIKPPEPGAKREDYLQAAKDLNADYYITGYVTPVGDSVSLVDQVVSTYSGIVVWSNTTEIRNLRGGARTSRPHALGNPAPRRAHARRTRSTGAVDAGTIGKQQSATRQPFGDFQTEAEGYAGTRTGAQRPARGSGCDRSAGSRRRCHASAATAASAVGGGCSNRRRNRRHRKRERTELCGDRAFTGGGESRPWRDARRDSQHRGPAGSCPGAVHAEPRSLDLRRHAYDAAVERRVLALLDCELRIGALRLQRSPDGARAGPFASRRPFGHKYRNRSRGGTIAHRRAQGGEDLSL